MDGMMHGFMLLWDKFDRSAIVFDATKKAVQSIL